MADVSDTRAAPLIAGNALVGLADSGFTYSAPGMCSDPLPVVTDFVIQ